MNELDVDSLREAFRARSRDARPTDDCPAEELLWAAARGELRAKQTRELGQHAIGCPFCAEAWQLAQDISADVFVGGGGVERPAAARWKRWGLTAAAVLLVAMVLVPLTNRDTEDTAPIFRTQETTALRSLIPGDARMSRADFVLRWQGPQDARFSVQVATEDLRVLDRSAELVRTEYVVPAERLADLPNGARVVWQIRARLPDGTRLTPLTVTTVVD